MRSRESFNKAAKLYDEVRPSYPDEVIDWIIEKANINPNHELLELAPGTGQATRKFAERDYKIHAIELGDKLAELLLINMKDKKVSVDISSFEDWEPPVNKKYKLIYCATAWHWLDPKVKYEKTYNLLEDDGTLALLWNNSIGSANQPIMDKANEMLFAYHDEKVFSIKPKTKEEVFIQNNQTKNRIEESGHFLLEDTYSYEWSCLQPKEKLIKGFYSQSSYLSLSEKDRKALTSKLDLLFEGLEDQIETYFESTVYIAKKTLNDRQE